MAGTPEGISVSKGDAISIEDTIPKEDKGPIIIDETEALHAILDAAIELAFLNALERGLVDNLPEPIRKQAETIKRF